MKPIEETWHASGEKVWRDEPEYAHSQEHVATAVLSECIPEAVANARAALMAKAPEMARMLAELEFADGDECVYCGVSERINRAHSMGCKMDAILNAIGAR